MPIIKSNEKLPERPVVLVIYGEPGVCKTSIINTCDEPLLIDFDRGVDRSILRKDTLTVNSWNDVIAEEQAGTYKAYKTIGIDTAKAALDDYLMGWVIEQDYKLRTNKLGAYGAIGDNFKIFVNNRRGESADIVIVAHAKKDEDTKKIIPDVTGQSYQLLMRIADQVGYVSIKNGKRTIVFEPGDMTVGKNVAGLQEIEVPDKTTVEFKTFGATLVRQVREAISAMSEEQREALEKSAKFQEDIAAAETPEDLSPLVPLVNELPDYLKLPLRQLIGKKAKDKAWTWNKEAEEFEKIQVESLFSEEEMAGTAVAKFRKKYDNADALQIVAEGYKTVTDLATLYAANKELVDGDEVLTALFLALKTKAHEGAAA